MAPTSSALQSLLNRSLELINEVGLNLNVEKSVYMVCASKRYKNMEFHPVININGNPLKIVHSYKYLGIIISNDTKISLDVKRCINAF